MSSPPEVPTASTQDPVVGARAWQTLLITSVSIFLVAMDVTIVSVALPGIRESFEEPPTTLAWVFTSYNITFAALLLLAGKLGDRWGHRRAFLGGLGTFAVASLVAAVAPSIEILIAGRVLQAAGSALIYPASLALLLPEFPPSRRSMAIGVWGGIAGLGGALAPTLGAILVDWAGWRAVFFINLPFVVAAIIAGLIVLDPARGVPGQERFDPVAVPMAAIAVGALVLAIVEVSSWGWNDPKTIACVLVAAVLLPAFVWRSAHHPNPLLDLDLFRVRSFTVGNIAQALFVGSAFGWLVLMPSFFVDVWGWSPLAAGFGLAPAATIGAILSPFAGRLADVVGHRGLVTTGCLCGAGGTLWWAVAVGEQPDYLTEILPGMVLGGLGITAGFATLTGALMSQIPPRFYSMAGAARSTIFQLATAIGIAIAVAVLDSGGGDDQTSPYRRVWLIATACAAVAAVVMVVSFPRRRPT
ncbi:MAG: DHA2 family efflux MFS transporter permease subunit [Ilumatobacteraceae bacterium]